MSASQPIEWTVAQLAQAVERGQLELHYQPIVDLRSEQIVVAEALLRWSIMCIVVLHGCP
ncbi:EAL domain-containing protein, partial [Pseudomonas aeruginosa]|uniref:EAL domain-containing protein n=1 Tax=Pseudomonas aeruginosa TaxID=287 RepID=UPI0031B670FC